MGSRIGRKIMVAALAIGVVLAILYALSGPYDAHGRTRVAADANLLQTAVQSTSRLDWNTVNDLEISHESSRISCCQIGKGLDNW